MSVILVVLMGVTTVVLIIGILMMARGGEANRKHSNKLMVMRVAFQALALGAFALILLGR